MSTITRSLIDGLWPDGSAATPEPGTDLDLFLDALADNSEYPRAFLEALKSIRDPYKTIVLDDLEREYGLSFNPALTDAQRRANIANRKFQKASATLWALQQALDEAGFGAGGYGLTVYDNNGRANPNNFVTGTWRMYAGAFGTPIYAGNSGAYASFTGGTAELVVNGAQFSATPAYWGCGMAFYTGNTIANCGYYQYLVYSPIVYPTPLDPGYWPLFFFIGRNPTYITPDSDFVVTSRGNNVITSRGNLVVTNGGNGTHIPYINTIESPDVPASRHSELIELILRWKPVFTWGLLFANYV